jgi:hypothetical protein
MKSNKRASGTGAMALWFRVERLGRAVPECERCLSQTHLSPSCPKAQTLASTQMARRAFSLTD